MFFRNQGITFAIFFSLAFHAGYGQNFIGHASGNYAGVLGAELQPASLAGNFYKFDLYLAGGSVFATNNYYLFYRPRPFLNFTFNGENDTLWRSDEIRYGFITSRVILPSAMLTLKNGDGLGFSASIRTTVLADKLSPELANDLADGFDTEHVGTPRADQLFGATGMSWQEYGITYAKVLHDKPRGVLKAGATVKMVIGNAAFYVNVEDLTYTGSTTDRITLEDFQLNYGYSDNMDGMDEGWDWEIASRPAPGFDLGIEYLRKQQNKTICPTFDGSATHYHKKDLIDYTYKIGVALLDAGRLKFNYGDGSGRITGIRSTRSIDLLEKLSISSPEQLLDSIATFARVERNEGTFTAGLPTRLRVYLDYHIRSDFFVEAATVLNAGFLKFNDYAPGYLSYFTVTPRWEKQWFGVCLPLYANTKGELTCGAGIRAGPLVLGINDVLPILHKKEMKSQGFYVALKTFLIKRKPEEIECAGTFH